MVNQAITDIFLSILSIIAITIFTQIHLQRGMIWNWIKAHTNANQQKLIQDFAGAAVSFARKEYAEHDGPAKLNGAIDFVAKRLSERGIDVTPEELKGTVQKAYDDWKKSQPVTIPAQDGTPITNPVSPS